MNEDRRIVPAKALVSKEEYEQLVAAAAKDERTLSSWMRLVLLREVKKMNDKDKEVEVK